MNTSNIKTGFIFQWSGFSVIFILKPLKLILFHYCGVYILKGFSLTPYFPWKVFLKFQLQWSLFREVLILRSYFCHFARAIVELQQGANTINILKVKLESAAAAWRTRRVWSFYVDISFQVLTNTFKSLKYSCFQWCEFNFSPYVFFPCTSFRFCSLSPYLSVNSWPCDWLSSEMEHYFYSIKWKWPELKHGCVWPVWKRPKVQRGYFEWHQAHEPGCHMDSATHD